MNRAALDQLRAHATDLLAAVLSNADWAGVDGENAVLAVSVPFELLDDAFAVLGALEDLEDGHDHEEGWDREADYAAAPGSGGGFADCEPTMGWSNPGYDAALSWTADGSPTTVDNDI